MLPVGRGLFACGLGGKSGQLSFESFGVLMGGRSLPGVVLGRDFPGGGVGGRFPLYVDISCHLVSAFSSSLASPFFFL